MLGTVQDAEAGRQPQHLPGVALPLEFRKPVGEGGSGFQKQQAWEGASEGPTGVPASPRWGHPLLKHHLACASSKSSTVALC